MEETIQQAIALAGCVGVLLGAYFSGTGSPEPPENIDPLPVED